MEPIERHIKQHFDNKSYTYSETHWLEAQKLIAENKRRRRGWLYWWTGGVSVILLAVMVYWTFSVETILPDNIISQKNESVETDNIASSAVVDQKNFEGSLSQSESKNSDNSSKDQSLSQINKIQHPVPGHEPGSIKSRSSVKSGKKDKKSNISSPDDLSNQTSTNRKEIAGKNLKIPTAKSGDEGINEVVPNENSSTGFTGKNEEASENVEQTLANEHISELNEGKISADKLKAEENSAQSTLAEENPEKQTEEIVPITPVKHKSRLRYGFVLGYMIQKQFADNQVQNGAYLGGRITYVLSSKWSIGSDITFGIEGIPSVHFHHDVVSGYGFGRDSLVTDMYARRAITMQIPLAISYAIGKHTFSGMIGTRILLDAQAKMEKLHYTNADPENTASGAIISRSTMVIRKEQEMPAGALAPFSIYSGLRYGWMIGKGWGLETNISVPLYHKAARIDMGRGMAADQGLRIELGVLKVF